MDIRIYEMHAGVCVALGNAKRIQIIDLLQDGEKTAGSLREAMGIPKSNLSQHLNVMKSNRIVQSRREGTSMYYRITNSKIITACQLMREVLIEQLEELSSLHKKYTEVV